MRGVAGCARGGVCARGVVCASGFGGACGFGGFGGFGGCGGGALGGTKAPDVASGPDAASPIEMLTGVGCAPVSTPPSLAIGWRSMVMLISSSMRLPRWWNAFHMALRAALRVPFSGVVAGSVDMFMMRRYFFSAPLHVHSGRHVPKQGSRGIRCICKSPLVEDIVRLGKAARERIFATFHIGLQPSIPPARAAQGIVDVDTVSKRCEPKFF